MLWLSTHKRSGGLNLCHVFDYEEKTNNPEQKYQKSPYYWIPQENDLIRKIIQPASIIPSYLDTIKQLNLLKM